MNRYLILVIFPILCSCQPLSRETQESYKVLQTFAIKQKQKNNLELFGIGASIPDHVRGLSITFSCHEKLNVEKARRLFVDVANELLCDINKESALYPYLDHYPFALDDLKLGIEFIDDNTHFVEPPFVAYVFNVNGNICYSFSNDSRMGFSDNDHSEMYEQALDICKTKSL